VPVRVQDERAVVGGVIDGARVPRSGSAAELLGCP
jgi:hypothetical protein